MKRYNAIIESKINELSNYGYIHNFLFKDGHLILEKEVDDQKIVKDYVAEQVSIEAEFLYEEKGSAVITLMTNDGELGYVIDKMNSTGEFPFINFYEALDD
ncbi:hypothetical protein JKA74_10105 [Marivirga sp. S37H4]|uniref:Uncharacterized protein n=1 Tax=Marivirga aurantiaca TaxID=2802615 RepID=A0A935C8D0_9BACT|nr:hypothetical protein [Marivirga aurantiaca]MBK6265389.1 hypothetical protein [Marivirga aurantiaca]